MPEACIQPHLQASGLELAPLVVALEGALVPRPHPVAPGILQPPPVRTQAPRQRLLDCPTLHRRGTGSAVIAQLTRGLQQVQGS